MVNCRKSLTVVLLAVLVASCFAVFTVQPVAAYTGTITYSAIAARQDSLGKV